MNESARDIVARRRQDVEREIEVLVERIAKLRAELPDLEVAERVLTRLVGEPGAAPSPVHESPPPAPVEGRTRTAPKVPKMIIGVLIEARDRGEWGLEPKEITARIAQYWGSAIKPISVSTTAWRLWKQGQLARDEGGRYSVTLTNEAVDAQSMRDTSTASEANPVRGREAGQGGGT